MTCRSHSPPFPLDKYVTPNIIGCQTGKPNMIYRPNGDPKMFYHPTGDPNMIYWWSLHDLLLNWRL